MSRSGVLAALHDQFRVAFQVKRVEGERGQHRLNQRVEVRRANRYEATRHVFECVAVAMIFSYRMLEKFPCASRTSMLMMAREGG